MQDLGLVALRETAHVVGGSRNKSSRRVEVPDNTRNVSFSDEPRSISKKDQDNKESTYSSYNNPDYDFGIDTSS
uniref:Uncharacterized protein n=1 Tax=Ditylenchus dipsaci TaxID=166011 RepID=A0A915EIF9_9BILA